MASFKERLHQLRKEKGLSGQEFGSKFFVTKATISSWESGRTEPEISILVKIADFFDVSTDYLTGKSDQRTVPDDEKEKINQGLLIITKANELTEEDKKQIKDFADFLRQKNTKGS